MFNSLQSASSQQILAKTDSIVAQDRKLTLRLLEHLYEIDRRKLYLERGFASTFDYCTRHLKLSEPSAARRLRTARCVARYSLLYPLLESGELSLTVVAMVSKYLKPANVDEIVGRIKNKPKREVERIIAEYEPKALLPPDRVRMVVVAVPPTTVPGASRLFTVTGDSEKSPNADDAKSVVPSDQQGEAVPFASAHPRTETLQFQRLARVEFTAHEELMEKLDRLRSLMSHRLPVNATLEQLITFMADYVIAREDPAKRQERREARTTMQERVAVPTSGAGRCQHDRQSQAVMRVSQSPGERAIDGEAGNARFDPRRARSVWRSRATIRSVARGAGRVHRGENRLTRCAVKRGDLFPS
jgi:hypothetical protein